MKYYKKDVNIVNIGHNNFITVKQSIKYITNHLCLSPRLIFSSKKSSGWHGDNSFIHLNINKLKKTGWKPKTSIKDGVIKTLSYLENNKWLLD